MWYQLRFPIRRAAAISLGLIGGTTPAYADLGDQLAKLRANDGAKGDNFGVSVAMSGTTAIVGARGNDDNGGASGSAYLFDATTGWLFFKLLADDGAWGDEFGRSVAISGEIAIVGALGDDDNGNLSGSAYLFDTTTGQQLFKLLPNDGHSSDKFGNSVAISGATGIVGAHRDYVYGSNSGSAYLFDATTGQQLFKLLPNDGAAGDQFGYSVGISGATAIVGSLFDDDNGVSSGSAYLFDISDPANAIQIAKLLPIDGWQNNRFGSSVAISGSTAIVGAYYDSDNGSHSGSAYLFDISDPANPTEIAKLLPDNGAAGDQFGISVGISGAIATVGAHQDDDNGLGSGSAYLFDTATGTQIAKLLANDGAMYDYFALSVAISGEIAIVGAWKADPTGDDSGSAYLFDASFCRWDLDDNAAVGASDLLSLLVSWGPCKGCPADFDGNGSVGASDLLALLVNWGPCP